MLDWQALDNHFASSTDDDATAKALNSIPSGSKTGAAQHALKSSPTDFLEHELLTRHFQEAYVEVGRTARELIDMVLQAGIIVEHTQPKLEHSYKQFLKDSTELFGVIAHKMSRLRTKIDLSCSPNQRLTKQQAGKALGVQTPRSNRQATYEQRSQSLNGSNRDSSSSDRSHFYLRKSGANSKPDTGNEPSSIASAPPQQVRSVRSSAATALPMSARQPSASHFRYSEASWESALPLQSSAQTFSSFPVPNNDDDDDHFKWPDQPSTFHDLPQFDIEDGSPWGESSTGHLPCNGEFCSYS